MMPRSTIPLCVCVLKSAEEGTPFSLLLQQPKVHDASLKTCVVIHPGSSKAEWYLFTALIRDCDIYYIKPPYLHSIIPKLLVLSQFTSFLDIFFINTMFYCK